jgi:serine/threonine protein kinase
VHRSDIDHRADICALGIVLYELTTGVRAFCDNSDLITLERISAGDVTRPSAVVPGYPPELERILMKAMRVDPARRYQSAGAMGIDLEAYAAASGIPLGHAAVASAMDLVFGDRRARRRMPRGTPDVRTDPEICYDIAPDTERSPFPLHATARSQKPTIPLTPQGTAIPDEIPLDLSAAITNLVDDVP